MVNIGTLAARAEAFAKYVKEQKIPPSSSELLKFKRSGVSKIYQRERAWCCFFFPHGMVL
jgi:hypothetical protein